MYRVVKTSKALENQKRRKSENQGHLISVCKLVKLSELESVKTFCENDNYWTQFLEEFLNPELETQEKSLGEIQKKNDIFGDFGDN